MTGDYNEEQERPSDSGNDTSPDEVNSARRIDQLLSQNLSAAWEESRQRSTQVSGDAARQTADTSFSWMDTADEQQARPTPPRRPEPMAELPTPPDRLGDVTSEGPSLLDFDEVARSEEDEREEKPSLLRKFFLEEEKEKQPDQEMVLAVEPEEPVPLWGRFWQWLRPSPTGRDREITERFLALEDAIYREPDVAVNYVIRGELYLDLDELHSAARDFKKGEALAEREFVERRWGVVAQALRDRARQGLEKVHKQQSRIVGS